MEKRQRSCSIFAMVVATLDSRNIGGKIGTGANYRLHHIADTRWVVMAGLECGV